MTHRSAQGIANSLLFSSILVVSALYHSELGGPGSLYNSVNVGLIGGFLLLNRDFDHGLVLAFSVPLAFLAMSVAGNVGGFGFGSYRAAGATAIGYVLFTLRPVPLHHRLLRRIVTTFLIVNLVLSVYWFTQGPPSTFGVANANFNRNPNGASAFFVGCVMLSLALVKGRLGWMLAVPFMLLTVTTGSRAGAVVITLMLLGCLVFSPAEVERHKSRALLRRIASNWTVWVMASVAVALAVRFLPDAVDYLMTRFEVGQSRSEQWEEGWANIRSLRGFLFGGGPATLGAETGAAAHSSYIEAIGNCGVFFLATTLIAMFAWLRRLVRNGCRDMLWLVPPVLVYGLVENILFNGINSVWLLTMLLGIAAQSREAGLDVATRTRARGLSPVRRAPPRQLVTAPAPLASTNRDTR